MRRRTSAHGHSRYAGAGWLPAAALFVVLGVIGSTLAAHSVARSDENTAQHVFANSSTDIVARLRLALRHEDDFAASTGAFLVTNPNMSNRTFAQWLRADRAFARYPEIPGVAKIVIVSAAQLPAYAAKAERAPVGKLAPGGSFVVTPPGARSLYCFVALSGSAQPGPANPAGLDYCANPDTGSKLLRARDTGRSTYEPYQLGKTTVLAIQQPIYSGGGVPATVAARRASFLGLAGFTVVPAMVIGVAESGQTSTRVALRYSRGSLPVVFRDGPPVPGGYREVTNLHNGWTVTTSAAAGDSGIFAHWDSLLVLVGGAALALVLALLGLTLTTGRARALRLVAKQTAELHAQAEQLRATVDELTAAQAVREEFVASVSHELRTPLTSIRGYAELLQDDELTPEQQEFLRVIESNSDRLLNLVEDLLLMTQIQSGGIELQLRPVTLGDLVDTSTEAARPAAAHRKIAVEVSTEENITTQGDSRRLGQAIDNLVSNAIKYTPIGGHVEITMSHTPHSATIAVTDSGIGIPTGDHDQMFDRFFRASNAVTSSIAGTGLGLAITQAIVEAHGGTIGFDSVESVGTTFSVTLPRDGGAGLESAA